MTMTTNIPQSTTRGGVTEKEGAPTMTPHDAAPQAAPSKPGSKPDAKDDLKSLPLAEVEKQLGSSPDGLTQAEAVCAENLNPNVTVMKSVSLIAHFLFSICRPPAKLARSSRGAPSQP
jgi:hypothetical protein